MNKPRTPVPNGAAPERRPALPTASVAQTIVGRTPAWDDPTENYHEASRAYPGVTDPTVRGVQLLERSAELRASVARSTKRHRCLPAVPLPMPDIGDARLGHALAGRRSFREFAPSPLPLAALASLLGCAYGVSGSFADSEQHLRTSPSGGALFPLELYVVAHRVDELDAAVYHYDPLRHALERLRQLDGDSHLAGATPYPELVCPSAAVVVVTAMFWRSRFKYGARAYRFTLIEAGHVAQNLLLAATALRVAAVPVGGFYDRIVDEIVGADGLYEASLYLLPLGAPAR